MLSAKCQSAKAKSIVRVGEIFGCNISLKFFLKERIKRGEDSLLPPRPLCLVVPIGDSFTVTRENIISRVTRTKTTFIVEDTVAA